MGLLKPALSDYFLNFLYRSLFRIEENTSIRFIPADATSENLLFEKTDEFTTTDTNGIICFNILPNFSGKLTITFQYYGKFILEIVESVYQTGVYMDYFGSETSYTDRTSTISFPLNETDDGSMPYLKVILRSINGEPAYLKNFRLYGMCANAKEYWQNVNKKILISEHVD